MRFGRTAAACALWLGMSGVAGAQTHLITIPGVQDGDNTGWVAVPLGDHDLDGVVELLITRKSDPGNGVESGSVAVVAARTGTVFSTMVGTAGDCFGWHAAMAGDVDADGIPDVIVSATQNIDFLHSGFGYVRVYSGADFSLIHHIDGTELDALFGNWVAGVGDTDGDGHDDFVVGAPYSDGPGGADVGKVILYSGQTAAPLHTFQGKNPYDGVGWTMIGPGDLDGDGHDDVVLSAVNEVLPGGETGIVYSLSGLDFSVLHAFSNSTADLVGYSLAALPDMDGDDVADYLVGATSEAKGTETGDAFLVSGASGAELHRFPGNSAQDLFGFAVADGGDLDGDGVTDLVITAPLDDKAGADHGAVWVYSGATYSQLPSMLGGSTLWAFGGTVASLGDVTGDGRPELAIGEPGNPYGTIYGPSSVQVWTLQSCPPWWANYGSGWPGTLGVPGLTLASDPVIGSSITLHVGNSRGATTPALLLLGLAKAAVPTNRGGTVLAVPFLVLPLVLPGGGVDLAFSVNDAALCGLELDLQGLEADPGASHGISFTPGLEIHFGGTVQP